MYLRWGDVNLILGFAGGRGFESHPRQACVFPQALGCTVYWICSVVIHTEGRLVVVALYHIHTCTCATYTIYIEVINVKISRVFELPVA